MRLSAVLVTVLLFAAAFSMLASADVVPPGYQAPVTPPQAQPTNPVAQPSGGLTCSDVAYKGVCVVGPGQSAYYAGSVNGGQGTGEWKTHIITTIFGCGRDAQKMASGIHSLAVKYYAALPSRSAVNRRIEVRGPNGRTMVVPVLDVGPMCVADNQYVFGNSRPLVEGIMGQSPRANYPGVCVYGGRSTGAALDLSCDAGRELGVNGKGYADWRWAA